MSFKESYSNYESAELDLLIANNGYDYLLIQKNEYQQKHLNPVYTDYEADRLLSVKRNLEEANSRRLRAIHALDNAKSELVKLLIQLDGKGVSIYSQRGTFVLSLVDDESGNKMLSINQ